MMDKRAIREKIAEIESIISVYVDEKVESEKLTIRVNNKTLRRLRQASVLTQTTMVDLNNAALEHYIKVLEAARGITISDEPIEEYVVATRTSLNSLITQMKKTLARWNEEFQEEEK